MLIKKNQAIIKAWAIVGGVVIVGGLIATAVFDFSPPPPPSYTRPPSKPDLAPSVPVPAPPKPSTAPAALLATAPKGSDWRKPGIACGFMKSEGLLPNPGVVKPEYYQSLEDNWSCLTARKDLGEDGEHGLPNTISYLAEGNATTIGMLELYLNVNVRKEEKSAKQALLSASKALFLKAVGSELSQEIATAIQNGKPGEWNVSGITADLRRDDWPTGKGYTLSLYLYEKGKMPERLEP